MKWISIIAVAAWLVAQPAAVRADEQAEARAAFQTGREHFEAGRYPEAARALERAYKLKAHPALLRYLGDTYYAMDKVQEALRYYRQYVEQGPPGATRDKVVARVHELEHEAASAGAAQHPGPASQPDSATEQQKIARHRRAVATGEDTEVPLELRSKPTPAGQPAPTEVRRRTTSAMAVMKWVAVGLSLSGLAMGIMFNRLAAGNADDLVKAARLGCPPGDPNCGGNPNLDDPRIPYAKTHFDLEQAYRRDQALSIASFSFAGAAAVAAATLFIFDRPKREQPVARRASLVPLLHEGLCGLSGALAF